MNELQKAIEEQKRDMNSNKVIVPKPKRNKMTKKDYVKWNKMREKGRL